MSSEVLNIYKTPSSQFFEVISKCLNDVIRQDSVTKILVIHSDCLCTVTKTT